VHLNCGGAVHHSFLLEAQERWVETAALRFTQ